MKLLTYLKTGAALVLPAMLVVGGTAQAQQKIAVNFYTVRLPNYIASGGPGGLMGGYPKVEGYDVVWTGMGAGHGEIFHFDGSTTTQVTNTANVYGNWGPHISSWLGRRNVVYAGDTGGTDEIFHYNIDTGVTTRLTSSAARYCMLVHDFHDPYIVTEVSNAAVTPAWMDVDLWDGTQIITLNTRTFNCKPQVSNYNVLWEAFDAWGGISDIFLYVIGAQTTMQLTGAPPYSYHDPKLSDPHVIWWRTDGSQTDVIYGQLSGVRQHVGHSNSVQTPVVDVSGPHAFWAWTDDTLGYGVFYYHYEPFPMSGRLIGPPTHTGTCDSMDTCNSHLAVAMHEPPPSDEYEICVWDVGNPGSMRKVSTSPRTSQGPVYVQVSSKLYAPDGYIPVVVWEENLGLASTRAYMATQPVCTPIPIGDVNRNCRIDMRDYSYIARYWGQSWNNPWEVPVPSPDLDGDLDVDWLDMQILRANWLQCNIQPPIYRNSGVVFPW
jgi:hypothetical protein